MTRRYYLVQVVLLALSWKECQTFVVQYSRPIDASSSHNRLVITTTTTTATTQPRSSSRVRLWSDNNQEQENGNDGNQKYRNVATEFLSKFMMSPEDATTTTSSSSTTPTDDDPWTDIDFNAPKKPIRNLETLAALLDYEIYQSEWFVTGRVNPVYFAEEFVFQDPDVTLEGIENYARGVRTIFDQATSRAEVIETFVNPDVGDTAITCKWRLSGKANIGPAGLAIKPYIVYSDFTIRDGLIVRQEDRFTIPPWDILLSAIFPFLIGKVRVGCYFYFLFFVLSQQLTLCPFSST